MMEQLVAGYESALSGDFEDLENTPSASVAGTLAVATRRRWRDLADERLDGVEPKLSLGKKFWPLTGEERTALQALIREDEVRAMITALRGRAGTDSVTFLDAAYWMKGCSSLGRLRYAVMVRIGAGKKASFCIIDVKEAIKPAAPRYTTSPMPRDNAVRVVTGARALSPYLGQRMLAARLLGKAVVLRELMPQDLKIEVAQLTPQDAETLAAYLAGVVGRAHGRQMDLATREAWRAQLARSRADGLQAPTWLWTSVVDLLSVHEGAYLEHCRTFALGAVV
jgi:uncharacterized protein (DUF2252 family)